MKKHSAILLAFLLVPVVAAVDSDGDGLEDDDEINIYGTNPNSSDTDGDGLSDGSEVLGTPSGPSHWIEAPEYLVGIAQRGDGYDVGDALFTLDGTFYLITSATGSDNGGSVYHGYEWDGGWVSNTAIIANWNALDLASTDKPTPSVFELAGETYALIPSTNDIYGFKWNGVTWVADAGIRDGLPANAFLGGFAFFEDGGGSYLIAQRMEFQHFVDLYKWGGSSWALSNDIDVSSLAVGSYQEWSSFEAVGQTWVVQIPEHTAFKLDSGTWVEGEGFFSRVPEANEDSPRHSRGAIATHDGRQVLLVRAEGIPYAAYTRIDTHVTNPNLADTDGEGLTDFDEVVTRGLNPNAIDSDGDGLADDDEVTLGTVPHRVDSDGDGLTDGGEVNTYGTNPLVIDSDGDGLTDGEEVNTHGTDPAEADTDGDGYTDAEEIAGITSWHIVKPDSEYWDSWNWDVGAQYSGVGPEYGSRIYIGGSTMKAYTFAGVEDAPVVTGIGDHGSWQRAAYSSVDGGTLAVAQGLGDDVYFYTVSGTPSAGNPWVAKGSFTHAGSDTNPAFFTWDGKTYLALDDEAFYYWDGGWVRDTVIDNGLGTSVSITGGWSFFRDGSSLFMYEGDEDGVSLSEYDGGSWTNHGYIGLSFQETTTVPGTSKHLPYLSPGNRLWLSNDEALVRVYEVEGRRATDPLLADTDGDGLSDYDELETHFTDPLDSDHDGDGISDGDEILVYFTDALADWGDEDLDGLLDSDEVLIHGTSPTLQDTDGDGLLDPDEINTHGTDPTDDDTDGDGLSDGDEINTHGTNPNASDTDGDGLSDGDEVNVHGTNPLVADTDGDTLSDGDEVNVHGTNPLVQDTDGDGLLDQDEINTHGTDPADGTADADADGLLDQDEVLIHETEPLDSDTDGDTLSDGDEVNVHGTNPLVADTDGDGLSDPSEINTHGTNPLVVDTDGDGLSDGDEINTYGTDPLDEDTDGDSLSDGDEVNTYGTDPLDGAGDQDSDGLTDDAEVAFHGTDPDNPDTDGDGLSDGDEVNVYSTNPLVGDTDGDGLGDGEEANTYGTDPFDDEADADGDGLLDQDEILVHSTLVHDPDTDGDGLTDGDEVNTYLTSPTNIDSDGDGLEDGDEVNIHGTDPADDDTDGDGLTDGDEVNVHTTDPLDDAADLDGDGILDQDEVLTRGTNPFMADTDGDGVSDGEEVALGLNPLDTDTDNDGVWDSTNIDPTPGDSLATAQGIVLGMGHVARVSPGGFPQPDVTHHYTIGTEPYHDAIIEDRKWQFSAGSRVDLHWDSWESSGASLVGLFEVSNDESSLPNGNNGDDECTIEVFADASETLVTTLWSDDTCPDDGDVLTLWMTSDGTDAGTPMVGTLRIRITVEDNSFETLDGVSASLLCTIFDLTGQPCTGSDAQQPMALMSYYQSGDIDISTPAGTFYYAKPMHVTSATGNAPGSWLPLDYALGLATGTDERVKARAVTTANGAFAETFHVDQQFPWDVSLVRPFLEIESNSVLTGKPATLFQDGTTVWHGLQGSYVDPRLRTEHTVGHGPFVGIMPFLGRDTDGFLTPGGAAYETSRILNMAGNVVPVANVVRVLNNYAGGSEVIVADAGPHGWLPRNDVSDYEIGKWVKSVYLSAPGGGLGHELGSDTFWLGQPEASTLGSPKRMAVTAEVPGAPSLALAPGVPVRFSFHVVDTNTGAITRDFTAAPKMFVTALDSDGALLHLDANADFTDQGEPNLFTASQTNGAWVVDFTGLETTDWAFHDLQVGFTGGIPGESLAGLEDIPMLIAGGADPVTVNVAPVIANPGDVLRIIVHESYLDATARTGNAAGTTVLVLDSSGTLVSTGNPVEVGFGAYRYSYTVPLDAEGAFEVIAITADQNTGAMNSAATAFYVEDSLHDLVGDARDEVLDAIADAKAAIVANITAASVEAINKIEEVRLVAEQSQSRLTAFEGRLNATLAIHYAELLSFEATFSQAIDDQNAAIVDLQASLDAAESDRFAKYQAILAAITAHGTAMQSFIEGHEQTILNAIAANEASSQEALDAHDALVAERFETYFNGLDSNFTELREFVESDGNDTRALVQAFWDDNSATWATWNAAYNDTGNAGIFETIREQHNLTRSNTDYRSEDYFAKYGALTQQYSSYVVGSIGQEVLKNRNEIRDTEQASLLASIWSNIIANALIWVVGGILAMALIMMGVSRRMRKVLRNVSPLTAMFEYRAKRSARKHAKLAAEQAMRPRHTRAERLRTRSRVLADAARKGLQRRL